MLFICVLVFTVCVGLVTVLMKQRRCLKLSGPHRLPLLGNVLQMRLTKAHRSDEVMASWETKWTDFHCERVWKRVGIGEWL